MMFRKLVAREGLIILGVLIAFGLSFYLESVQEQKMVRYGSNVDCFGVLFKPLPENAKADIFDFLDGDSIFVTFPKGTDTQIIENTIKGTMKIKYGYLGKLAYGPLHNSKGVSISHFFQSDGSEKLVINYHKARWGLMALYPSYLIVLFVVWAIKILVTKKETSH